ncbi:ran-binding protein [Niveomyces insectorum RCEF 264]|uniref:Ran-binding protein n=1 Tax=Niveomyces insectorum RCEF 264 TaxID=1081102 RepID=A0A162IA26_9HYPO|nr:ran-binding protein [Niveomyces insectorum RCEF 264]
MSNPYQIPPSAYQDDPSPNLSTGLQGFSLRRSSYASVASGGGSLGRSGATFAQLLNPTSTADGSDSNGIGHNGGGSSSNNNINSINYNNNMNNGTGSNGYAHVRTAYGGSSSAATATNTADAEALRNGIDTADGALLRWLGSRNPQLPAFSRAFEPFLRGPAYDGYGPIPSNNGFFTPSYLRESVYVKQLEDQYRAKTLALRDSEPQQQQQHQQQQHHHLLHNQSPTSTITSTAAATAAAAAAAGGMLGVGGVGVGGSGVGGSNLSISALTGRGSSHSLHNGGGGGGGGILSAGGAGGKIGPGSYRGIAYDVVEKVGGYRVLDDEEAIAPLPSRWDKRDKPSALDVLGDGLEVKYTAPKSTSERDSEAISIRADHYMPPQCGIYYFEVTILSKKREESTIGIGFSDASASLSRPPGWESHSWGYHSDDGNTFNGSSNGRTYGPLFGSGDIVGCGVNFRTGTVFYTKNGDDLGIAFNNIRGEDLKLFPTVGLKRTGEHVRVNFGQVGFAFAIDDLMEKERMAINKQIAETSTDSLAPPLGETELVQQLVLQFLQHDGYVETARAFAEEIQAQKEALNLDPNEEIKSISITDDEDARNRQRIRKAVLEGDLDRALKLTNAYYPHVLKDNEDVYFRLRCRKFVEMIRKEAELNLVGGGGDGMGIGLSGVGVGVGAGETNKKSNGNGRPLGRVQQQQPQDMDMDDIDMVEDGTDGRFESQSVVDEAIAFGQALQSEFASDPRPEIRSALKEIFSLLAYANPLKEKEVAHLMDQRGRVAVAEELNSAILLSLGKSSRAALETVYAQTTVLLDDLRQDGGPGSFVTIQGLVDQIPKPSSY